MATSPTNTLTRQIGAKKSLSYPVDSANTYPFNAGDMVALNAGVLKPLTVALTTAFAGVAQNSSALALYTKDGAAVSEVPVSVEVLVGQVHRFQTTTGDTFTHMCAVKCGADAQTVTSQTTSPDTTIGYAFLPGGNTLTSGNVGAGKYVEVLIVPVVPSPAVA